MEELICFEPILQERIWGGCKLGAYGFDTLGKQNIGEAWTLADHQNGQTKVNAGRFSGDALRDLWSNHPEIFGVDTTEAFPLLIKWIDAADDLSVQVHPDDHDACRLEGQPYGKNECWYIVDCPADATIIYGHDFKTKADLLRAVREDDLTSGLIDLPVSPGDFFYVPAGTVHALTEGCLVIEIQQNSDTTYRLYDYDRIDHSTNKPRQLHLKEALEVIQFPHFQYEEPYVPTSFCSRLLTTNAYFFVEEWAIHDMITIAPRTSFQVITIISGTLIINQLRYTAGDTVLIPAKVTCTVSGKGKLLLTGPNPTPKQRLHIGIDLGGTHTRVAAINQHHVVKQYRFLTEAAAGPDYTINHLRQAIQKLLEEFEVERIGIAAPGPLDAATGRLLSPPNLPGWDDVHLVRPLEEFFNIPVSLENDANAAALGEALFGAGQDYASIYYMTVSTGIGGGYVYQKTLIRGAHGYAGEIGNTIIDASGPEHPVLNKGSLEGLASGTALQTRADSLNERSVATLLRNPLERLRFVNHLATGIANIIHTLDPEAVIIGGGVTASADLFWEELLQAVNARLYPTLRQKTIIRLAALEGNAGVIGAAHLNRMNAE